MERGAITYENALKLLPYGTILEFFKLEDYVLSDFVVRGVYHMIKDSLNYPIIHTKFEYTKDKSVDVITEFDEFVRVVLLQDQINISSTKVLYCDISKKYFN